MVEALNVKQWSWQLFVAADQLLNILITPFSGDAWADETISARAYRGELRGDLRWARVRRAVDWVALRAFGQIDHCYWSLVSARLRMNSPVEER